MMGSRMRAHTPKPRQGGGIIPVRIVNGELFFLFGRERFDDGWSDFGGAHEEGEETIDTAIREGYEELSGLLGNMEEMATEVRQNLVDTIDNKTYVIYVYAPCAKRHPSLDELPVFFQRNYDFVNQTTPKLITDHNGLYEKTTVRWFSAEEAATERESFRRFYRHMLDSVLRREMHIRAKMADL